MALIMNTVRQIILFSLISFIILELVPKEEYKQYLNTFSGMILILIAMNPIVQLCGNRIDYSDYLERILLKDETKNDELYFGQYDELRTEAIVSQYREEMVRGIARIVEGEQCVPQEVDIRLNTDTNSDNFLKIEKVDIVISKKYAQEDIRIKEILMEKQDNVETLQEINIKNKISQFYNVDISNINISK